MGMEGVTQIEEEKINRIEPNPEFIKPKKVDLLEDLINEVQNFKATSPQSLLRALKSTEALMAIDMDSVKLNSISRAYMHLQNEYEKKFGTYKAQINPDEKEKAEEYLLSLTEGEKEKEEAKEIPLKKEPEELGLAA